MLSLKLFGYTLTPRGLYIILFSYSESEIFYNFDQRQRNKHVKRDRRACHHESLSYIYMSLLNNKNFTEDNSFNLIYDIYLLAQFC